MVVLIVFYIQNLFIWSSTYIMSLCHDLHTYIHDMHEDAYIYIYNMLTHPSICSCCQSFMSFQLSQYQPCLLINTIWKRKSPHSSLSLSLARPVALCIFVLMSLVVSRSSIMVNKFPSQANELWQLMYGILKPIN